MKANYSTLSVAFNETYMLIISSKQGDKASKTQGDIENGSVKKNKIQEDKRWQLTSRLNILKNVVSKEARNWTIISQMRSVRAINLWLHVAISVSHNSSAKYGFEMRLLDVVCYKLIFQGSKQNVFQSV